MPRPNAVIRGIVDLPLPRVRISSLPLEIITHIFELCPKESLAMLSAVCWSFSLVSFGLFWEPSECSKGERRS